MKKHLSKILILIGIIFLISLAFYYKKQTPSTSRGVAGEIKISQAEKNRQISENIQKYQPKKTKRTKEAGLNLSAVSAIVVDQNTNEIVYQKNPNQQLPPASIAKVLTFSVILEAFKPTDYIEISQRASEQISNKINMKPGEKIKTDDLLYGLMMISANDAAYAFADAYKGGFNKFMGTIAEKIEYLGLANTSIKSPAGLDEEGQFSSAFDMATITRYALLEHPEFVNYAGKKTEHSVMMSETNEPHWWFGHLSAMLKRYPGMIAAKTGYTDEARSTYVGVADRNGKRMVVVIFGSNDANNDVPALLDFGFAN